MSTFTVPLRWRDLDAQGHVYNATYLTLLDEGRSRWLRSALELPGFDSHAIVSLTIDYVSEIGRDIDEVNMEFSVAKVGNKSFTTEEVMTVDGGRVAARVSAVLVGFDTETRTSSPLTEEQREILVSAQR